MSGFFTLVRSRDGPDGRGELLRHDALEAQLAGLQEQHGAVLAGVVVKKLRGHAADCCARCSGRRYGP
jgi:hypothetical protein